MVTVPVQAVARKAYSPYGMVVPVGAGLDRLAKPLGGVSVQFAPPPERVAITVPAMPCGVPVTVSRRGTTELEGADGEPVPTVLIAATVNVYAVPLVSPVRVMGEALPVTAAPPGLAVTVYPVIAAPPEDAGAIKLTDASALPALAVPMVGAPGSTAFTAKLWVTWGAGK